jgi:uncharacterized protein YggE
LRDLSQYDALMEGLVNEGVNKIDNVVFQSSKLAQYQSEARKLAMKDAKLRRLCVSFRAKVGKAVTITDNSQNYQPQPLCKDEDNGDG